MKAVIFLSMLVMMMITSFIDNIISGPLYYVFIIFIPFCWPFIDQITDYLKDLFVDLMAIIVSPFGLDDCVNKYKKTSGCKDILKDMISYVMAVGAPFAAAGIDGIIHGHISPIALLTYIGTHHGVFVVLSSIVNILIVLFTDCYTDNDYINEHKTGLSNLLILVSMLLFETLLNKNTSSKK